MEEHISLYADDMLLYIGNAHPFVGPVMDLASGLAYVSTGTNRRCSLLDPLPPIFPQEFSQLPIVSEFKYLGIIISPKLCDFIKRNLSPLLITIVGKINRWCKLSLSVIGRANLIKMIPIPQLLYILHNTPIWIPAYFFHRINRHFRELLWEKKLSYDQTGLSSMG